MDFNNHTLKKIMDEIAVENTPEEITKEEKLAKIAVENTQDLIDKRLLLE